ncbi:MAG: DNA repair protein RecO [Actinomycetaceae bacterium]|nr:DNA repair protein RecO [Actinomycetaceae bacterium]
MRLYRDEALVLRTHDLGEADRIITLLTRAHGRVRGVAKGVRRTKSRFGARLEPFSMVDVQLYQGRSLDVITEAATLNPFGRAIAPDYEAYTAANAMAEVAERLTPEEGQEDEEQYLLLLGAVHSLAVKAHDPALILDSYLLRAMALSGWAVAIWDCARCGRSEELRSFHVASGGMVCDNCAPRGSAHPAPATVELLGALLSGDWPVAEAAGQPTRRESASLISAYLQWHIERQVRSLRLVEPAS